MLERLLVTSIAVAAVAWSATIAPAQETPAKASRPASNHSAATDASTKTKTAPAQSALSKYRGSGTVPSTSSTATTASKPKFERATFGGGCFWHVEAEFESLKGVRQAVSGYAGGVVPFPSYEMVHSGTTGHAEVVMVEFDPSKISYEQLLKVFWSIHDPTSINRQGEDEGPQYRSIIFYHNEEQRRAVLKSYHALTAAGVFGRPIVTQLAPMTAFYRAEDYHQDYYGGKLRASSRRSQTASPRTKKSAPKAGRARPAATAGSTADPRAIEPPEVPASARDPFADVVNGTGAPKS
jgi:peptide-methionine (S)-S-oxide reductase